MSAIVLADEVVLDVQRILDDPCEHAQADQRPTCMIDAFEVLGSSPRIGQPSANGCRELVIGRGRQVCVALYRYDESADMVTILAIRAQKESGYHLL
ncbi:MAG: type II toxin-antitoxin system RelE/ParE family toxin [Pseudomonadota bacterium]